MNKNIRNFKKILKNYNNGRKDESIEMIEMIVFPEEEDDTVLYMIGAHLSQNDELIKYISKYSKIPKIIENTEKFTKKEAEEVFENLELSNISIADYFLMLFFAQKTVIFLYNNNISEENLIVKGIEKKYNALIKLNKIYNSSFESNHEIEILLKIIPIIVLNPDNVAFIINSLLSIPKIDIETAKKVEKTFSIFEDLLDFDNFNFEPIYKNIKISFSKDFNKAFDIGIPILFIRGLINYNDAKLNQYVISLMPNDKAKEITEIEMTIIAKTIMKLNSYINRIALHISGTLYLRVFDSLYNEWKYDNSLMTGFWVLLRADENFAKEVFASNILKEAGKSIADEIIFESSKYSFFNLELFTKIAKSIKINFPIERVVWNNFKSLKNKIMQKKYINDNILFFNNRGEIMKFIKAIANSERFDLTILKQKFESDEVLAAKKHLILELFSSSNNLENFKINYIKNDALIFFQSISSKQILTSAIKIFTSKNEGKNSDKKKMSENIEKIIEEINAKSSKNSNNWNSVAWVYAYITKTNAVRICDSNETKKKVIIIKEDSIYFMDIFSLLLIFRENAFKGISPKKFIKNMILNNIKFYISKSTYNDLRTDLIEENLIQEDVKMRRMGLKDGKLNIVDVYAREVWVNQLWWKMNSSDSPIKQVEDDWSLLVKYYYPENPKLKTTEKIIYLKRTVIKNGELIVEVQNEN